MNRWRKSSFSFSNGNCVEADGDWAKSSHSAANGACVEWRKSSRSMSDGQCVEVGAQVRVRDSQDPDGPVLAFGPAAWAQFTGRLRGDAG